MTDERVTVLVDHINDEMKKWLKEVPNSPVCVEPNTFRVLFVFTGYHDNELMKKGPPIHPLGDEYRDDGWKIQFECKETAVLFKLTFPNEVRKPASGCY